jgi:hypothetical protein
VSLLLCLFIAAAGTARAAFVDNGDGTVTDTNTGLMWQQADDGVLRNWDEAVAYCESLVLPSPGGHDDWRAPRIDELETIINYSTYNPVGFDPPFVTRSYGYWSGSTLAYDPDGAWRVGFDYGSVSAGTKTNVVYVRCVRGGPGSLVPLTLNKSGTGTGRVSSDPTRIDCGTSCPTQSANFAELTQVTLTARADPGSNFRGWSGGGCSGTVPCVLTMGTDPTTVTAQFDRSAPVPTFSQWGLIIFAILTAASAVTVIRRRRRS